MPTRVDCSTSNPPNHSRARYWNCTSHEGREGCSNNYDSLQCHWELHAPLCDFQRQEKEERILWCNATWNICKNVRKWLHELGTFYSLASAFSLVSIFRACYSTLEWPRLLYQQWRSYVSFRRKQHPLLCVTQRITPLTSCSHSTDPSLNL